VALNKKAAAPRLGALTAPVEKALAGMGVLDPARQAAVLGALKEGTWHIDLGDGRRAELGRADVRLLTVDEPGFASEYGSGLLVRIDARVTPALRLEGLAREALHGLQNLRKAKGLAVTDRVRIAWRAEGDLAAALREHAPWLAGEVLALGFDEDAALDAAGADAIEVEGARLLVRLRPVSG
jgi:isoleucyl-tRNA synthetase